MYQPSLRRRRPPDPTPTPTPTLPPPGCIFHYDDGKFKQGNGVGFKEEDTPNFTGSYYSKTKAMVEDLLRVGGGGVCGGGGWVGGLAVVLSVVLCV